MYPRKWSRRPRARRRHLGAHRLRHLVAPAAHRRADPCPTRAGSAPRRTMASSAAGTTPATRPGRPACAAPATPATGSASSTGVQSAVSTASGSPRRAVTTASARGRVATPRAVDDCDVPAVHLMHPDHARRVDAQRRGGACAVARTAAVSSPTEPPRLRLSRGAALTPPHLSVKAKCAPRRSRAVLSLQEVRYVQFLGRAVLVRPGRGTCGEAGGGTSAPGPARGRLLLARGEQPERRAVTVGVVGAEAREETGPRPGRRRSPAPCHGSWTGAGRRRTRRR